MRLRAALAGAVATLGAAAPATAVPVVSGQLDHRWANVFDTTAPANTDRTWLGDATGPTPSNANGTVSAILPGSGPTLNVLSARGRDQIATYTHPASAVGGSYDPATRTGTLEFTGGIRFEAPPFPAGHGFTITFENPRVVLDGATGQLFASGTRSDGTAYDKSEPVYDLDLSAATFTDSPAGTSIVGIIPRIATEALVYPSTYAKGAGPERTPNTFGSFSLSACASAVCAAPGAAAPPASTPAPTPAASATPVATRPPKPPRPVASRVKLTRKRLAFRLNRVVATKVVIARAGRRVSALRFTPSSTAVSLKLSLEPGRYRVSVTPKGGSRLSTLRSVR